MAAAQSGFGLIVLFAIAWALSEDRRRASPRVALAGIAVQIALAAVLLKLPLVRDAVATVGDGVRALQAATEAGTSLVFGYLGGAPLPFETRQPGASFVLAFRALPLIIVVSALTTLLTHWRILPWLVRGFALVLRRSLGVGGAVGLAAAANIFVGMVEAPLFVRPYLKRLSRSELFVLMTCGMATIAGTVFVLYVTILEGTLPGIAGHLLVASVISAPAAIAIATLMVPAGAADATETAAELLDPDPPRGAMDAITRGTESGLKLYLVVVAMLIVLIALVHLANALLAFGPDVAGDALTLERLVGWLMAPVVWLMGVPWSESVAGGQLMGIKTVLNELIAYLRLAEMPPEALSPRSRIILAYALCGFANFGSLGIMIGGLATMVPERRDDIVGLGFKSIVSGTLATCSTGAVAGLLI